MQRDSISVGLSESSSADNGLNTGSDDEFSSLFPAAILRDSNEEKFDCNLNKIDQKIDDKMTWLMEGIQQMLGKRQQPGVDLEAKKRKTSDTSFNNEEDAPPAKMTTLSQPPPESQQHECFELLPQQDPTSQLDFSMAR